MSRLLEYLDRSRRVVLARRGGADHAFGEHRVGKGRPD
jgi:hypothetical protein